MRMMTPIHAPIVLSENGPPVDADLPANVIEDLRTSEFVTVARSGSGCWSLKAATKVGVVRVGPVTVHIQPKIGIGHLLFLLGYTINPRGWWTGGAVDVAQNQTVVSAVADAFSRQAERALLHGTLQGYTSTDAALPVLRGRLRSMDQLRYRFGVPHPLEVTFDEFGTDTPENRILRSAAELCLRMEVTPLTRGRLQRVLLRLADVPAVRRGTPLPGWQPTRLNVRYQPALALGELLWRNAAFDASPGRLRIEGFLLNMADVFENFVCRALDEALREIGCVGSARMQYVTYLDTQRTVTLKPDFTWFASGKPALVADAKYKAEKPSGYPNADVYQMLAYCTALHLKRGHLIYAKGESRAGSIAVVNSPVHIVRHAVDLGHSPESLLAEIRDIARHMTDPVPPAK